MDDIYTKEEMEEAVEFIASKINDNTKYDEFSIDSIKLMCEMVKLDYERLYGRYAKVKYDENSSTFERDKKTKTQLQTFTKIIRNLVNIHKDENGEMEVKNTEN